MKRLSFALLLTTVLLTGFGCAPKADAPIATPGQTVYENAEYGFALTYDPTVTEVKPRPDDVREDMYLGLPVDFFVSIRHFVPNEKPENLAYVYTAKNLSVEGFTKALTASDPANVKIISTGEETVNGVTFTKVLSTTAALDDKTHYLWIKGDTTLIFSVFLTQEELWQEVFQTFVAH